MQNEVLVDDLAKEFDVSELVRKQVIEADVAIRQARNDQGHARKQLDAAEKAELYWRGRADSLRALLDAAQKSAPLDSAASQTLAPDGQAAEPASNLRRVDPGFYAPALPAEVGSGKGEAEAD